MRPEPSPLRRLLFVGGDVDQVAQLRADAARKALPWEISSASDPLRALTQLAAGAPDVVIAQAPAGRPDMRILLQQVRQQYPKTACIAFCRKPAEVAPGAGAVQWVPYQTDAAALQQYIERSFTLQRQLGSDAVERVGGNLEDLPSVPSTYLAITQAAARPETGLSDIARIVEGDPVLSLKVLHLVNSAFFGIARRTTSIAEAVALLGIEQLKGLVLATHVFGALQGLEPAGFSLTEFQRYSVRAARLAKSFIDDRRLADDAFTAGILHDVGKMVLALRMKEAFGQVLARVSERGERVEDVERELLGVTHSSVGAYLLSTWEIPFSIVESVAFHHQPSMLGGAPSPVLAAVHAADALIGIVCCNEPEDRLDVAYIERAGFGPRLNEWRRRVEVECEPR
ncbi:MAG: HDOD domain-containing protein [Archangiaceae bacterium]|nr:HDOD domain-containing protein [Archangiaceae bacterium]